MQPLVNDSVRVDDLLRSIAKRIRQIAGKVGQGERSRPETMRDLARQIEGIAAAMDER